MMRDAFLAYLHFASLFIFFGFLTAAFMLLRGAVDARCVQLLKRCDAWIGASALAVAATGFLRVFLGAKGAAFYLDNPLFWGKLVVFAAAGLLAIPTGRTLGRWAAAASGVAAFAPDASEQQGLRRRVLLQIHLLALVPLLAALMARGVGH